jgi:predicted nucleotidyltransferase
MDSFPRNELPPLESMNSHCETSYNYSCQQKMINIEMREAVYTTHEGFFSASVIRQTLISAIWQHISRHLSWINMPPSADQTKHALFAKQSQD